MISTYMNVRSLVPPSEYSKTHGMTLSTAYEPVTLSKATTSKLRAAVVVSNSARCTALRTEDGAS